METNLTEISENENTKTKKMSLPIREVETLYFDKEVIHESGISLRRLDHRGLRNYFTLDPNNFVDKIYTSVTTFTRSVLPTNDFLLQWVKNKSKEEQEFILKSSAAYGTLLDVLYNELLINREVKEIGKRVIEFTMREGLYNIDYDKWEDQLKKDTLCFVQFIKDYDVRPLLVSCPLKSDELGIAGTLDLCCTMNDKIPSARAKNPKPPERITAIIDYKAKIGDMTMKSERNSFYESEALQLYTYAKLVAENFPDIKIDSYLNFSPNNWRTNPGYNLKDWTDTKAMAKMIVKFESYHKIYTIDCPDYLGKSFTIVKDEISLDEPTESNIETVSLTEFINSNLAKEMAQ